MTTPRSRILQRVRVALGRNSALSETEAAPLQAYMAQHAWGPRPCAPDDMLEQFRACAARSSTSVEEVGTRADLPAAVAHYLQGENLPLSAVIWPELADLDWHAAGVVAMARKAQADDAVGITGCFCALAETGTLLQLSAPGRPASTSLVPATHIAVLAARRIVASMEDAWELLRAEQVSLPRAANLISGPSRTADIEQTLVLGAHGPCRVHVVVVVQD